MYVYVVLEEARAYGVCTATVAGVFLHKVDAEAFLASPNGANCYLASLDDGEPVQGSVTIRYYHN
jgi:hypothetical protein